MSVYLSNAPDLADFVHTLSACSVRYLVVGGYAVGFHAQPRATKDLDVWLDAGEENRSRVLVALQRYGAPATVIETMRTASAHEIVWFGRPPSRIDLLQQLPGLQFHLAYSRRALATWADQQIHILGIEDLIRNKETVGRPQDLVDAQTLRALDPHKG